MSHRRGKSNGGILKYGGSFGFDENQAQTGYPSKHTQPINGCSRPFVTLLWVPFRGPKICPSGGDAEEHQGAAVGRAVGWASLS